MINNLDNAVGSLGRTVRDALVASPGAWGPGAPDPSPPRPIFASTEKFVTVVVAAEELSNLTPIVPPRNELIIATSSVMRHMKEHDNMRDFLEVLENGLYPPFPIPCAMIICVDNQLGSQHPRTGVMMDWNLNLLRFILPRTAIGNMDAFAPGATVMLTGYRVLESISHSSLPVRPWMVVGSFRAVRSRSLSQELTHVSPGDRAFVFDRRLLNEVMVFGEMHTSPHHEPRQIKQTSKVEGVAGKEPSDFLEKIDSQITTGWRQISVSYTDTDQLLCQARFCMKTSGPVVSEPQPGRNNVAPLGRRYHCRCLCFEKYRLSECVADSFPPTLVTLLAKDSGVDDFDIFRHSSYAAWYLRNVRGAMASSLEEHQGGICPMLDASILGEVADNMKVRDHGDDA